MRKISALFCMLVLLTLSLVGCAESVAGESVGSVNYNAMSEEDARIRRIADAAVAEEFGITDFSDYGINIDYQYKDYGIYHVEYTLRIHDYCTKESVTVKISSDFEVENVHGNYFGQYSRYLKNATEEAVRQAEEKLDEQVKFYEENSGYYLSIDNEGYLCLNCEAITHRAPPAPAVDGNPDGEETAYIDHEHLFFSERICPKP